MCLILFLGGCQAKKRKEKKCLIKNEFNSALYFSFRANVPSKSHFCIVFFFKKLYSEISQYYFFSDTANKIKSSLNKCQTMLKKYLF